MNFLKSRLFRASRLLEKWKNSQSHAYSDHTLIRNCIVRRNVEDNAKELFWKNVELKEDFVNEDKGPIFGHLKEIAQVILELHLQEPKDPREKNVKLKHR